MELSRRVQRVSPSATIAVTSRARQMMADGIDVVSFGAGEPDFDTPGFIKDAAHVALDAGDTKYVPRAGAKLKAAIAEKLQRENALTVSPDQVLVTFGGKHALYDAFQALLNPGEKVLIPVPYWVSYPEQVKLAGGECAFLATGPENGFKIDPDDVLKQGATGRILVLNSPCNPTGVTYTPEELAAIAEAVLKTNLIVLADEIYEKLIYGSTKFVSFASLDERLPARTLTFNSLAKTFSMPGWRLGWVAGALAAYTDPAAPGEIERMRQEFEKRGRHMHQRLNAIEGVTCIQPTGAFYCFPDVSAYYGRTVGGVALTGSMDFATVCLDRANVALVPGVVFGEDRCVRLSFATGTEQIDKGLDRLEVLLKQAE